ncbi:MAG: polysaccharide ABC transporter ATP-binding protein [Verrucomicrobiota bacterium]
METAITVRGLSKAFTIRHQSECHTTLYEAILHWARHPFSLSAKETFWALRDISFELKRGEVVGIIGRNGAGKSTLLKVLSQITEPTRGEIDLHGRVGSLLEVGTGFHPELTGRENIFLNGAILGMNRREIISQFDAIVEFAGIEKFLDTPVKRYSSGMYVRLAFAVAAHLNPEILIVDEVLAVGDAEFQKKCLGKMQDVAHSGRTVIFVSHNMQAVSLLCTKGILLSQGKLVYCGGVGEAIDRYVSSWTTGGGEQPGDLRRPGSGEMRFVSVQLEKGLFDSAEPKAFHFSIERQRPGNEIFYLSAHVVNQQGIVVAQADSRLVDYWLPQGRKVEGTFRLLSPWLKPGSYRLDLYICAAAIGIVDAWEGAATMHISPLLPYPQHVSEEGTALGLVFADFQWKSPTPHADASKPPQLAPIS